MTVEVRDANGDRIIYYNQNIPENIKDDFNEWELPQQAYIAYDLIKGDTFSEIIVKETDMTFEDIVLLYIDNF